MSILLDAGPSLNFLAVGQQNILIQVAESQGLRIEAPERVEREVLGMAKDPLFAATAVRSTWDKLRTAGRVSVLADDVTSEQFAAAITRASGMPASARVRERKSLGEILVIAHASVHAQSGVSVYILLDDGDGRRRANREIEWLRARAHKPPVLWSTPQVLRQAGRQPGWIAGGHSWERVYDAMRTFDAGLPPRR